MAFVYWITVDKSLNPLTDGYIGITKMSVNTRLNSHRSAYLRFVNGKDVGCKKLYATVKLLGGWENVTVTTICESNLEYCLSLENKLRPEPNVGWNTRVGGDHSVMYKREITSETRNKLAEVRKSWVLSQESKNKLSSDRKGSGNPMYKTLPWLNPASNELSQTTWLFADVVYEQWSNTRHGVRRIAKSFKNLNYWTLDSMIRKFRDGWIPRHDNSWVTYKGISNDN